LCEKPRKFFKPRQSAESAVIPIAAFRLMRGPQNDGTARFVFVQSHPVSISPGILPSAGSFVSCRAEDDHFYGWAAGQFETTREVWQPVEIPIVPHAVRKGSSGAVSFATFADFA